MPVLVWCLRFGVPMSLISTAACSPFLGNGWPRRRCLAGCFRSVVVHALESATHGYVWYQPPPVVTLPHKSSSSLTYMSHPNAILFALMDDSQRILDVFLFLTQASFECVEKRPGLGECDSLAIGADHTDQGAFVNVRSLSEKFGLNLPRDPLAQDMALQPLRLWGPYMSKKRFKGITDFAFHRSHRLIFKSIDFGLKPVQGLVKALHVSSDYLDAYGNEFVVYNARPHRHLGYKLVRWHYTTLAEEPGWIPESTGFFLDGFIAISARLVRSAETGGTYLTSIAYFQTFDIARYASRLKNSAHAVRG
ncbi:hypothetical protein EV421DRAFT_2013986 [Armillaria borealis]|uniref:Uncharacterized protein n=1 Tax=Armillaria borealis TaxID=47425 RepID=A0AA39N1U5_9AGAR|nr:hypothetical protein EV421DRAFT_2013986 [Armillaria borealis]